MAVAAAQDKYDRWSELATGTNVKKKGEIETVEEKRYIDPVPLVEPGDADRYSVASLELKIEESNQIIESSQAKVVELYLIMASDDFKNGTGDYASPEKRGEIIYQFRCNAALRAGHLARKASLEEAMATQYHPATLEGARAAAKNAVSDYYYAKRAYDEFYYMEYLLVDEFQGYVPSNTWNSSILSGGTRNNLASGYDDKDAVKRYGIKVLYGGMGSLDEPEVHAMLLAGQKVQESYWARQEELYDDMVAAKEVMNQKLTELNDQEIAYEKKLTSEGAILQRQAMLKVAFEEAGKAWNGENKNGPKYTVQKYFDDLHYETWFNDAFSQIIKYACLDLANIVQESVVKDYSDDTA